MISKRTLRRMVMACGLIVFTALLAASRPARAVIAAGDNTTGIVAFNQASNLTDFLANKAHPDGIIYVDVEAGGAGTGASWVDAYPDLQTALAASASGDQIWVAAGT